MRFESFELSAFGVGKGIYSSVLFELMKHLNTYVNVCKQAILYNIYTIHGDNSKSINLHQSVLASYIFLLNLVL